MSYSFQPPLVGLPVYFYPASPLYYQLAPVLLPLSRTTIVPCIRIKAIFHRAGTVLGSNDAVYHTPPSREALLGNLAWWSKNHGLGDRVYSGQATLYLTSSLLSTLSILPETGVVRPSNTMRIVSLAEQHSVWQFENMMSEIGTRNLGAFIVVDVGAFDQIHGATSQNNIEQQQNPPVANQEDDRGTPPDNAPTDDQPPDGAGTGDGQPPQDQNDGQTQQGNDEPEPSQGGTANG
ncbi:hypothetical protein MRS44_010471 [Fusarium solani]|jgi:hypothetical protein|uniref:Uncharacterized protein n=1 Tax=Fusarium solani TaxID=169388 RepID=A0A9P9GZ25_FUSSL|nr:uncharacterized protein B0J15DRAFT_563529 [Fusarium solani]KAH7248065.1 hypothetical protein B0J15DRAFT_563529 [Fusarium solani]KAJ3461918.1 hypothetical protein MRS44_010471 [Fusarium solani]